MLCSQNEELYTACERGRVAEVERLLSRGGDVSYHSGLVSCLHVPVAYRKYSDWWI